MASGLAKDVRRILDVVEDRGFRVERGSKHFKVLGPDGKGVLASVSTTPSDRRTLDNLVGVLKRQGVLAVDPRKEGQVSAVATMGRPTEMPPEQQRLRGQLREVLQVIPRTEFARHVVDLANSQNQVRTFGSNDLAKAAKAALWHIGQLDTHGRPIARWAAFHIDAAVQDVLKQPDRQEAKGQEEQVVKKPTQDEQLRNELLGIAEAIQAGLQIPMRRSRKWGHGLWTLMGKLAVEAAERHDLKASKHTRGKPKKEQTLDLALGNRIKLFVTGEGDAWAATKQVAKALVEDWDNGYRLRQDMFVDMIAIPDDQTIPEELRATRATPKIELVREVPGIEPDVPAEPEPDEFDSDDVSVLMEAERFKKEDRVPPQLVADVMQAMQNPTLAAWEDGQMPLHLRILGDTLKLMHPEFRESVDAVIESARQVMLAELGSH